MLHRRAEHGPYAEKPYDCLTSPFGISMDLSSLLPVLAVVPIAVFAATSLAIAGAGNRKIWTLIAPCFSGLWIQLGHAIASLIDAGSGPSNGWSERLLVEQFFTLSLPIVLCVVAWKFRCRRARYRPRPSVQRSR